MAKKKEGEIRIGAKALAELAMPDFDPQAFWVKSKVGFKTPFGIFPGIFSTLDKYQKTITSYAFARKGHWPPWVCGDIESSVPCPHWSKFCFTDEETGITVSGAMDDCYKLSDGTLLISDNKLAMHTDTQDKLLPLYEAQLNIYAEICRLTGIGNASKLLLVYHEPVVSFEGEWGFDFLYRGNDYLLRFDPKVVEITLKPNLTAELLVKAKELMTMEFPPEPRDGRIGKDVELVLSMARAYNDAMLQRNSQGDSGLVKPKGNVWRVYVDGKVATTYGQMPTDRMVEDDPMVLLAIDASKASGGKGEVRWAEEEK